MTARSFTRAGFIASIAGASLFAVAPAAFASRDNAAEQYVQTSAVGALAALGNHHISADERHTTFERLISQLADMPRIAFFVLGRYSNQLRTDPQLRADWYRTFEEYSIATYEDKLDAYSDSVLRVINSVENVPGQDVTVVSEMTPRGGGRATRVQWRLLKSGGVWKVTDVALGNNDSDIWLAQQQQRDFLAALDANHGDIRALITQVSALTQRMRARIMARN